MGIFRTDIIYVCNALAANIIQRVECTKSVGRYTRFFRKYEEELNSGLLRRQNGVTR